VELTVSDCRSHPDIARQVREATKTLRLEVLKVLPPPRDAASTTTADADSSPSLGDLRPDEVFAERLRREKIDVNLPEGRALVETFTELMSGLHDTEASIPAEASP
jgi:hypothetical protein